MAHVTTEILRGSRTSAESGGKRTATTVYYVEFNDKLDGAVRARTAPGVPREGDGHPDDGGIFAKSVSAQETDDPRIFHVTVNYEQRELDNDDGGGGGGETDDGLPSIRIGSIHENVVADKTWQGNPIVNSARQPFIDPPTIRTSNDSITVSGTTSFDAGLPAELRKYRDTVNDQGLFGYDKGELLLVDRDIKTRVDGGDVVWDVSLTWEAGEHRLILIDNGLYENGNDVLEPISDDPTQGVEVVGIEVGEMRRVVDSNGLPMATPVLLNGRGGVLDDGAQPVRLPFAVRKPANHQALLRALGLPTRLQDFTG